MVDIDLEAAVKKLKQSLRQIQALLAWEELKRSEAMPAQPQAFTLNDSTETDLRNEYSSFLSTSVRVHSILNDNKTTLEYYLAVRPEDFLAAGEVFKYILQRAGN